MTSLVEVPSQYFVTSGSATSPVSNLNAFDQALLEAEIGEQNIVPVSSVLPVGIEETDPVQIPRGAITHCVLSQERGTEGETISAGIAYAFREDGDGGYVAEGHGKMGDKALREILEWKINEIAKHRDVALGDISYRIEAQEVPMDEYGACLAALVLLP
ncbi:pyruvoyl-dependent arginine decarboxylase [Thermoplasmatales archaeon SW_10_69_26]|nr:MAG: pyruvoyl-dependent arginine decarboxylase [Thermoplasmatales archaeon SW_10_69_26]